MGSRIDKEIERIVEEKPLVNAINAKLVLRYITIGFIMYMAWMITQPGYAKELIGVGQIGIGAIYGSVFGALTLILKSNFEQKIDR